MSDAWDRRAWTVASDSREAFAARLADARNDRDRDELLRMRLRWRIDEFAEMCVRPYIEETADDWAPNNAAHLAVYSVPPLRAGLRKQTLRRAILSTRGVGKSGGLKVRGFHGFIFGLTNVSLVACYTDPEAVEWADTLRGWCEEPCPEVARLWPSLTVEGNQHALRIECSGHTGTLMARGWRTGLRGINKRMVRPDRVFLDDVDNEEDCSTEANRDKQQRRLTQKVMPLEPMQGGAEFWWANTPPHPDSISSRAQRRLKDLTSWDVRAFPAVNRWPESPLWDEVQRIYTDYDANPDPDDRYAAAADFYDEHRDELDEGADVLDPHRMGILRCFLTRIDVGPIAWETEYQVNARAVSGRIFDPATWRRFRWVTPAGREPRGFGDVLRSSGGTVVRCADLRLAHHWDWSDGGDNGAVSCLGREASGRAYAVETTSLVRMPLTAQAREWARSVIRWRVNRPQIETPSGTKSSVEDTARAALAAAMAELPERQRFPVHIEWKQSTERKEARISTLEAPLSNGRLEMPEDLPASVVGRFEDFDPSKRNNADDELDATQRAWERLAEPVPQGVRRMRPGRR